MSLVLLLVAAAAPPSQFSEDRNRRMLADFAACVVHRRPHVAARYLLKDLYTPDSFLNPDCLPRLAPNVSLYAPPLLIRYAVANALIQSEPSLKLPDLSTIPPLDIQTSYADGDQSSLPVLRFGECVVRTAPEETTRFLHTGVATREEESSFQALGPAFSSCLFAGQTAKFSREVVRGSVAINYYRLAHAGIAQ